MIKSELVQIIASRNPHLFLRDVENIVGAIFEEITEALGNQYLIAFQGDDDGKLDVTVEGSGLKVRHGR